ncbi:MULTISPECIES: TetR/AcrR family transcriptional regulator [unclassified Enterococcus]|uniref:TetR/AcrR family transcriptional regulator n=1 Tax=unclassified Enterococcus TaxID=2608891 RepID=UPI0013EA83FA|nr:MULTISPECIES: TetR/AcrR family transcriptional regulator [unclassified Enterococcus]
MNGFEKRAQEKKKQILKAAFELMNTDGGTANLTMEKVAEQSHVSKATIFKYFGNKESLIYEVFFGFIDEIGQSAREIAAENLPFEDTLIKMSKNKISYLNRVNKQFYLDLMDYYTKKEEGRFSSVMESYLKESFEMMLDLFHRGRKEGKVDWKYSDEFLILYFQAMVEGISSPEIYGKLLPYTEEWTELLIKGIAPNKKGSRLVESL